MMTASERLRELDGVMTPRGELNWWFDGRDIFHKKPGTNLDLVVVPLGHLLSDTFTVDGAINRGDVEAWVALRNALPLIADVVEAAEDLAAWTEEQQAATGAEMLTSLALRINRDRAALAALREALVEK